MRRYRAGALPRAAHVVAGKRIARSIGRDWFCLDWGEVWERMRLAPHDCPGVTVRPQPASSLAGDHGKYPAEVHLTHLSMLGYEPEALRAFTHTPPAMRTPGVILRPLQVKGVAFIRSRRGTLLADEQRVGKTPQLIYSHEPEAGALIIVGPLAARAVWHEWAARRFGQCSCVIKDGEIAILKKEDCSICRRVNPGWYDPERPSFVALSGRKLTEEQLAQALRARVIFLHYAILPEWRQLFDRLPRVGTLGVDEAHLSGVQNRKGLFFESIRFLNTVAHRSVMMTGTPLLNKPRGLWPMLDVLTPGAFGDFWTFARRYCGARPGAHGWTADGATNQEELRERLSTVMIRRTWAQASPNMPPITRTLELVRLDDSKRDRVEELAARIRSQGSSPQTAVGDLARLRKLYAAEKITASVEHIRALVLEGKSVIAWTWHKEAAASLLRVLASRAEGAQLFGPIDGDMSPDDRESQIETARIVSASRPTVLIATMATLGTAVNLSFAQHEAFVELDWNPHHISQAEMRPFDGTRPICATYFVADCDVEQKLADALLSKLATMDALGLAAGVGSVESILRASLGVDNVQTLSALADAIMEEAA